jgi:short-subunit dehydrogenase
MRFNGNEVLLTGGAGGLGRPLMELLQGKGARVTVLDRVEAPGAADCLVHDIGSPEGLDAAARNVARRRWDTLINLAGIQHFGPVEAQSPEHLVTSYIVNLVAPVRLAQAVLPAMKAQGSGRIVNVGSIFGSIGFAHFASYSSAKAGLRGFSQALRRELRGSGVGVTYVAPRAVRTALNSGRVLDFAKVTGMRLDEPDVIAERIVEAIRKERPEAYFGFPESLFVRVNAVFPGLVDRALSSNDRKAAALFAS